MIGSRPGLWLSSLLLGAAVLGWTTAGETSNPQLAARELPSEILNECGPAVCAADLEFRADWVGHTPRGDLFIVGRTVCAPDACSSWLVEKNGGTVRKLLELPGSFRLHRLTGRYPVVELNTRTEGEEPVRVRFEWNGNEYARTGTQRVFEVSGVACGTREECYGAADRAFHANDVDQAQRIWQQVGGISWI